MVVFPAMGGHAWAPAGASEVSLAEPDSTFGFPEVRVGGLPAVALACLGADAHRDILRSSILPWLMVENG